MSSGTVKNLKRLKPLLGTFVEIGASADDRQAEVGISKAFEAVEKIQNLLSFHDPKSDLSILNQNPGAEIQMHPLSLRVLRLAKLMTIKSGGLFNLTSGGKLVQLGVLPEHQSRFIFPFGGPGDLEISRSAARLKRPVQITLDGIAKGFAVDMAIREMKKMGVIGGWVNAGGDLRVFGDYQLPVVVRAAKGQFFPIGTFQNTAIATSETRKDHDTRFPGSIVSPLTENWLPGLWTVKANFAWKADALTKVACLASPGVRGDLIRRLGGELIIDWMEAQ